jgi:hypothetical protein
MRFLNQSYLRFPWQLFELPVINASVQRRKADSLLLLR